MIVYLDFDLYFGYLLFISLNSSTRNIHTNFRFNQNNGGYQREVEGGLGEMNKREGLMVIRWHWNFIGRNDDSH